MNWIVIICLSFLMATFMKAANDQHEKMKRVEQSINRHEAYPYYLIHKPQLPVAPLVPGVAGAQPSRPPERKPCEHICFVCLSKQFIKPRS